MPPTKHQNAQDRLRAELERLARLDWGISPAFPQTIQALLTALDYQDAALMRSHVNTAFQALQDLVRDAIQKRLGRPQLVRECWRNIWEILKACPMEDFDEVGKELEALFNTQLESLLSLRDGPVQLLEGGGYEVDNAAQLCRDIEELQTLKEGIFADWPWSDQVLPPVDRQMVAESRAAIARNEGEPIEDLIRRLGGSPGKGS